MTIGYVFNAGTQKAISNKPDGSNVPAPAIGKWVAEKEVDVDQPRLIGFDPDLFAKQGWQIWPAPKPFAVGESSVGGPDRIGG